jgi:hypothetical protein
MSNNSGNHFDNALILYFFLITAILYSGVYFVLNYLGMSFSDVTSNGNVITPIINSLFTALTDFTSWITTFSLSIFGWTLAPFEFLSGIASGFNSLITQMLSFVNVWNILNIYLFYILFVPFAVITVLIITDLVIRLIEGLIP